MIRGADKEQRCFQEAFEQQADSYRSVAYRPSFTPLCLCALVFWAACALCYSSGRVLDLQVLKFLCLTSLAGSGIVALVACNVRKTQMLLLSLSALLIGVALASAQSYSNRLGAESIESCDITTATLTLLEDSSSGSYYESAQATLKLEDGQALTVQARIPNDLKGLSVLPAQGDEVNRALLYGQTFEVQGRLSSIDYSTNEYAWQNASVASFKVDAAKPFETNFLIQALINLRQSVIGLYAQNDNESALLQAITCGYRHELKGSELYGAYQSCGLAHLVAVSGAHLVIVTGLFAELFRRMKMPRRLAIVLLVGIMISYLVLSGAPISALRATIMSSVGILALIGKRRPSSQNALGISIFAIIVSEPSSSLSLSLALSALSTLGIVLFAPLFSRLFERMLLGRFSLIVEALALTCAASVLSQGLACSVFSLLPLVSPLANVATAPFFPVVCSLGLLSGVLAAIGIPGWTILFTISQIVAALMNAVVCLLAAIPYSAVPLACDTTLALVVSGVLAFLLWVMWERMNMRLVMGVLVLFVAVYIWGGSFAYDRIVMLDVGQGDAFLIQSKGQTLLIDTGNQDSKLIAGLARAHIHTLDLVALTHPDDDHVGSLDALNKGVQTKGFILPRGVVMSSDKKAVSLMNELGSTADRVQGLEAGDSFTVGAFAFTVLWPVDYSGEDNADSLCLWAEYDGNSDGVIDFTALFTGDAETDQITQILQRYRIEHVDILKVGHHGSKNALSSEQALALSPKVALISVGAQNRYGHPAASIIDMLLNADAQILRTDTEGQVEIRLSSDQLVVQ